MKQKGIQGYDVEKVFQKNCSSAFIASRTLQGGGCTIEWSTERRKGLPCYLSAIQTNAHQKGLSSANRAISHLRKPSVTGTLKSKP